MKTDKKTNRFNLALDDDETAVLDNLSAQLNRRRTDILRDALAEYNEKHGRPPLPSWQTRMSQEWHMHNDIWVNRLDRHLWLNNITAERLERQNLTPSEAMELAQSLQGN